MSQNEKAMIWTTLIAVVVLSFGVLLLNCGTKERMCIATSGVDAPKCLEALKGETLK